MGAKLSFELDAGKILAKLHCGACQTHNDFIFINTGITDGAKLKPEDVDKNKINFDMEGSEYELGVMFPTKLAIEHLKADVQKADEKGQKEADAKAEKEGGAKDGGDEDEGEDAKEGDDKGSGATDSQQGSDDSKASIVDNPKEKAANESVAWRYGEYLYEDYTKNLSSGGDDPKDKETPQLSAQHDKADDLNTMLAAHTAEDIKDLDAAGAAIADAMKELADTAKGAAAEAVKKNHDQIKKFMEKSMQNASAYLADYLKVFSGQDVKSKINEKSLALTYVPEGFDPYKTKKFDKYQIPAMTDEQVRQYKIQLLKKDPNEFNIERMCFKVAYTLDIGK